MEDFIENKTFLARWIAGELSPEELKKLKNSQDYPVLKKINEASQNLKTPTFNDQALLTKLKELNRAQSKQKVRKLIPNWVYAAAAIFIMAFGLFYIMTMSSQHQTGFGEQLAVLLPDNSSVKLNANSQLAYKTLNWKSNRMLELEGEAFFDVEKGESFKVMTDLGVVQVLGTEFNVISRDAYFEVKCMEGKVKVTSNILNKDVVLLPGKAVRIADKALEEWTFDLDESNWTLGESTFFNTPISQVIQALENQFNIKFDISNIDLNKRFTGAFTHKNLGLALKTVSTPMGISFTVDKENGVILLNSSNNNQ